MKPPRETPLRTFRKARGFATLAALAEATGLCESFLSLIERGLRMPGRESLEGLADVLGTDVIHLEHLLEVGSAPKYILRPVVLPARVWKRLDEMAGKRGTSAVRMIERAVVRGVGEREVGRRKAA